MAHGENAEKRGHAGKEYWKSRLRKHGDDLGRYVKILTHRKERRDNKKIINDEIREGLK